MFCGIHQRRSTSVVSFAHRNMNSSATPQHSRLWAWSIFVAASAAALAPRPAFASCGDYLRLGHTASDRVAMGQSGLGHAMPGQHALPSDISPENRDFGPDSPTPASGCRGGECSRAPVAPPIPIAKLRPVKESLNPWSAPTIRASPRVLWTIWSIETSPDNPCADGIFRPPRAS